MGRHSGCGMAPTAACERRLASCVRGSRRRVSRGTGWAGLCGPYRSESQRALSVSLGLSQRCGLSSPGGASIMPERAYARGECEPVCRGECRPPAAGFPAGQCRPA
eukprot:scaffold112760_cov63-Phaeocystis_antarctica.AAC.3